MGLSAADRARAARSAIPMFDANGDQPVIRGVRYVTVVAVERSYVEHMAAVAYLPRVHANCDALVADHEAHATEIAEALAVFHGVTVEEMVAMLAGRVEAVRAFDAPKYPTAVTP